MKVSIIVPFHNADRFIEKCCETLLAQLYDKVHYEIIMVDNNSSDRSGTIVSRYPGIILLHENQQGAYAARNSGLKKATGEIIAFTDPDCAIDRSWLCHIVQAFTNPVTQLIVGSYLPVYRSFSLKVLAHYENAKNRYIFQSNDSSLYYGYTNNLAARSALFQEFGPFNELSRGSDAIFAQHVVRSYGCHAVRYVDSMRVKHLEIRNQFCYHHKAWVHSLSLHQLKRQISIRSLTNRERHEVFHAMRKRHGYGLVDSMLAYTILATGLCSWSFGKALMALQRQI